MLIFNLCLVYLTIGFVYWILFVTRVHKKLDGDVVGAGWPFKLIILPGMLVLWPVFVIKSRKNDA